jgi:hypothetical protein
VLLPPHAEDRLIRCCYCAVWFEEVFRGGRLSPGTPVGQADVPGDLAPLLVQVPDYAVADVRDVVGLSEVGLASVREHNGPDGIVVGPTFDGSHDVGGADADWIAGHTLVDVKSTIRPLNLDTRTIHQLLGYLLLDYSDVYRIEAVGLYLSRVGHLVTWPVEEFLALTGATESLTDLRAQVADPVSGRRTIPTPR